MRRLGVRVDVVRTADHEIPPGVWPDMREQGYARDDFPALYQDLVVPADIVVLAGPIWLGDQSSLPLVQAVRVLDATAAAPATRGRRATPSS